MVIAAIAIWAVGFGTETPSLRSNAPRPNGPLGLERIAAAFGESDFDSLVVEWDEGTYEAVCFVAYEDPPIYVASEELGRDIAKIVRRGGPKRSWNYGAHWSAVFVGKEDAFIEWVSLHYSDHVHRSCVKEADFILFRRTCSATNQGGNLECDIKASLGRRE